MSMQSNLTLFVQAFLLEALETILSMSCVLNINNQIAE